eukprot:NODE_4858_length_622_cov_37.366492_g4182_i0.p2 GENE.NODE_4858_length_622_cov_37.366492_g4182_i0~~NODE_4858_length_622_cov_37.366492_g4182_i0.p2  ORF type:complete len:100 (-),score=22.84 NODE_4858_length_622_cov_37.366492_g4182_i0:4-303(-)
MGMCRRTAAGPHGLQLASWNNRRRLAGYFYGIIDILQRYNTSKKVAHAMKSVTTGEQELSTVPADQYKYRFESFIQSAVTVKPDGKMLKKKKKKKKTLR